MKTFVAFVFVIGVLITIGMAEITEVERKEFEKMILTSCKEPTKATDEDVKVLLDHGIPETRTAKCLVSCAQEKIGILVNGKVSAEGLKGVGAKKYAGNEKAIAIFNEMVGECTDVTGSDACELSSNLVKCMHGAITKRGYDPKKGIEVN